MENESIGDSFFSISFTRRGWDYYLLGENRKSSARRSGGFAIRRKKCSTY